MSLYTPASLDKRQSGVIEFLLPIRALDYPKIESQLKDLKRHIGLLLATPNNHSLVRYDPPTAQSNQLLLIASTIQNIAYIAKQGSNYYIQYEKLRPLIILSAVPTQAPEPLSAALTIIHKLHNFIDLDDVQLLTKAIHLTYAASLPILVERRLTYTTLHIADKSHTISQSITFPNCIWDPAYNAFKEIVG